MKSITWRCRSTKLVCRSKTPSEKTQLSKECVKTGKLRFPPSWRQTVKFRRTMSSSKKRIRIFPYPWNNWKKKGPKMKTNVRDWINCLMRALTHWSNWRKKQDIFNRLILSSIMFCCRLKKIMQTYSMSLRAGRKLLRLLTKN